MRNNLILTIFCIFLFSTAFSQSVQERIEEGIEFHKSGKYADAIKIYEGVLKEDSKNPLANYELAFTYFTLKEYDRAIKHCDAVIKTKSDISYLAYAIKGACEDYMGNPDKAIKSFKQGIKLNPSHHQLYYSLALTSYNTGDFKEAEEALITGIKTNPYHASSHMLLGMLKRDQKERSKSLLAFFYFLILEPTGNRADQVFKMVEQLQKQGVQKNDDKNITININSDFDTNDFGTSEMLLSLLEASKAAEINENKTDFEIFSNTNASFFTILGEQRSGKKGFFWDFYVDFFYELVNDKKMYEAFSHQVYQPFNDTANKEWLEANSVQIEKLYFWLKTYKPKY
jgi:tetratricopeptide (TPR) repeat protein